MPLNTYKINADGGIVHFKTHKLCHKRHKLYQDINKNKNNKKGKHRSKPIGN